MGIIWNRKNIH
jgi:hypothetical protein